MYEKHYSCQFSFHDSFQILWMSKDNRTMFFENIVNRNLPVLTGRFHADIHAVMVEQPL